MTRTKKSLDLSLALGDIWEIRMQEERPKAYLGILYDRIARSEAYLGKDPLEVIKEFAERGRADGIIDNKLYGIIQGMTRLPVEKRFNPGEIPNIRCVWILEYERRAYIQLTRYLQENGARGKFDFEDIDWDWRSFRNMLGHYE